MNTEFVKFSLAHLTCQYGFYFNLIDEPIEGVYVGVSHTIEDAYWNYCLSANVQTILENKEELSRYFDNIGRKLAILIDEKTDENSLGAEWIQFSQDLWMVTESSKFTEINTEEILIKEISDSDIEDACGIFVDAYTTGDSGDVGYSSLPMYYVDALRKGLHKAKYNNSLHYIAYLGDKPVALASTFFSGHYVGLYNVCVTHPERRRGFGAAISSRAIKDAFTRGAQTCFLQTEPDGPVEQLYAKLGFERFHQGTLYAQS